MSTKKKYEFEEFLADVKMLDWVSEEQVLYISQFHEWLTERGLKLNIKSNKTTPFILNFTNKRKGVFSLYLREKGLMAIVKAHNVDKYSDALMALSEEMIHHIEQSPVCKNLVRKDPNEKGCGWSDCYGYEFDMGETNYQICRYSCFQFDVDSGSLPHLKNLAIRELEEQLKNA